MAHFAELDNSNIVKRVVVVGKLLIIIISENHIAAKVLLLIPQKTNLFHLNHMIHGH